MCSTSSFSSIVSSSSSSCSSSVSSSCCCYTGVGQQQQLLLVSTCHIHWDPDYSDVKLIQTMMLMNELKHIVEEVTGSPNEVTTWSLGGVSGSVNEVTGSLGGVDVGASWGSESDDLRCFCCSEVPLILCGDFNSLPDSGWFTSLTVQWRNNELGGPLTKYSGGALCFPSLFSPRLGGFCLKFSSSCMNSVAH